MVATFQNMKNMGLEFDALDKRYASTVHADTSLALLKDSTEQNKYLENCYEYMEGLGKYLFKGDRPWSKPFMIFLKIYFTADGKAEYFLYNLSGLKARIQWHWRFLKKPLHNTLRMILFPCASPCPLVSVGHGVGPRKAIAEAIPASKI